jgi:uncharacterized membrane protein YbaN (DUF454 family)
VNSDEAKQILLLYRPGTADAEDPSVAEAISFARQDPELATWFEQHQAFQKAIRAKFRQVKAPEHLKLELLAGANVIRPAVWWQQPAWLAVAAAIALLVGYLAFWQRPYIPDHFADYRKMMVAKAEGQYGMDLTTSDMEQLRKHFLQKGAPADYNLPQGLQNAQVLGGVRLSWRTHPVSMVCLRTSDSTNVWLFVTDRSALKDAPAGQRKFDKVDQLLTASWTEGDQLYVLAAPDERDFEQKYFVR